MTSTFAQIILGLYIPAAIGLFFILPAPRSALLVILGGTLFLPCGSFFKIPLFPQLTKENLPYLCTFLGCLFTVPRRVTKLPKERWFVLATILLLVSGAITGVTNRDVQACGIYGLYSTPMGIKDGMAVAIESFLQISLPFFLGAVLFRGRQGILSLLSGFAIAGLIYSLFAAFEMRMSPQLHGWVYGYGLGAWEQSFRWGGYRPSAFMPHGLALARFMVAAMLSCHVLASHRPRLLGIPTSIAGWYLVAILVLCRSTGAILLGAAGLLLLKFVSPRRQTVVAGVLAAGMILYPLTRATGIFPTTDFLDAAASIQKEREESLAFRFANEDVLLKHAQERLIFGWGSFGRNRVCNEQGEDVTVTDGHWIILLGTGGLVLFISGFLVPSWPVLALGRRLRTFEDKQDKKIAAGFGVILILLLIDLVPNGLWSHYPYFMAGAMQAYLRDVEPREA